MINRDKNLIIKFPQSWRHPINTRIGCYRNNIIYLEFVKEYVFYNPNNEDIDEINGKPNSDCSFRYTYSYKPIRPIYNIEIVDMKEKKTKNKVKKRYTNWNDVIRMENETKTEI